MSQLISIIDEPEVSPLDHLLGPHLPQLAAFNSHRELVASDVYRQLRPEVERVLGSVVREDFATQTPASLPAARSSSSWRATAWNVERGTHLSGVIRAFREHPLMRDSDLLLLTELDYGMARSNNRFVAREIACALGLNYAFAPCYLALNKGSGLESSTVGENAQALHGNALFSRHPLLNAHSLALPNGKDKMRGKEKRLGQQRAVIADVQHPSGARLRAVSLHLDAHSSQRHRMRQMRLLLDHLDTLRPALPTVIGGDWNTSTYNSRRALYSIMGYWRRVLMGVRHVVENHYPYPERWFERHLFRELERRGYDYRSLNEPGACTLHYDVADVATNVNMADWIPRWCFPFIDWALKKQRGRCSLKLDWFAGKGVAATPDGPPPAVVADLTDGAKRLSDHDAIVLNFTLRAGD